MPEISRFYGIKVAMRYMPREHNPPHIHVEYADTAGSVDIRTGNLLDGDLSKNTMKLVALWIKANKSALLRMWETQEIGKLPPLE